VRLRDRRGTYSRVLEHSRLDVPSEKCSPQWDLRSVVGVHRSTFGALCPKEMSVCIVPLLTHPVSDLPVAASAAPLAMQLTPVHRRSSWTRIDSREVPSSSGTHDDEK